MDTLKGETEKQAGYHLLVAQQIKNELEAQAAAFASRQQHHKKTIQAAIEREFKTKQTQESYVQKAREKYESDCMKINSLTAQSTLEQGKELQKTRERLNRARETVRANENDFASFTRALQDTVRKWEVDWKAFCDSCQDLEEERMEFTKDNMWAYANAISTVCVADDEVRALDSCGPSSFQYLHSPVRKSDWPWNQWRSIAIWRTSCATTARAALSLTRLSSWTTPIPTPYLPRVSRSQPILPASCVRPSGSDSRRPRHRPRRRKSRWSI